jgi:hypothetical protein
MHLKNVKSKYYKLQYVCIKAYQYLIQNTDEVSNLVQALLKILGKSNMFAYLVMMGIRLLEYDKQIIDQSTGKPSFQRVHESKNKSQNKKTF